jgi:hypothetical protein
VAGIRRFTVLDLAKWHTGLTPRWWS